MRNRLAWPCELNLVGRSLRTTVALVGAKEEVSPSGIPKKQVTTSGGLADRRPAPGPQSSRTGSSQGAGCRCDCGWCDERARPLWAHARPPDEPSSGPVCPQSETRKASPARQTSRAYQAQGRAGHPWAPTMRVSCSVSHQERDLHEVFSALRKIPGKMPQLKSAPVVTILISISTDPSSVKSGSKPGISSYLMEATKKMNALPNSGSSNLPLLAFPDLTEEG